MAGSKESSLVMLYKVMSLSDKDATDEETASLLCTEERSIVTRRSSYTDVSEVPYSLTSKDQRDDQSEGGVFERYTRLLEKYPLVVKAITAFFILGLGDAAAQGVENLRDSTTAVGTVSHSFDWFRAVRFGAFGLVGAPWAHYYYFFLDKYFPPTAQPCSIVTALKLFIDQGLQAPALLALIISSLAILKGTGLLGVVDDLRSLYMHTLIANWILWVPASLVNMAFVQPCYRVLYVNLVFFFWTILLSILVNTSSRPPSTS